MLQVFDFINMDASWGAILIAHHKLKEHSIGNLYAKIRTYDDINRGS